jgi:hypothetical protein
LTPNSSGQWEAPGLSSIRRWKDKNDSCCMKNIENAESPISPIEWSTLPRRSSGNSWHTACKPANNPSNIVRLSENHLRPLSHRACLVPRQGQVRGASICLRMFGPPKSCFDRLNRPLTRSGGDWFLTGAVPATQFSAQIPVNWPAKRAEENLSANLFQQKFTRIDHLELPEGKRSGYG